MKTLEESVLTALLEDDVDEAKSLVDQMLPGERRALRAVAIKLCRITEDQTPAVAAIAG
jgi:hypothetical protein